MRHLHTALCFLLLTCLSLSMIGCTPTHHWDMNGIFVHADGTTEAVEVILDGEIKDTKNDLDELNLTIVLSDNFRYGITGADEPRSFISMNQKYNVLPHLMVCHGYAHDSQSNIAGILLFALDLEKEYSIFLFENAPHCYLVASKDGTVDHELLLDHFADFIEYYAPKFWIEK